MSNKRVIRFSQDGIIQEYSDMDSDLQRDNPPKSKWEYPYSYDPFTVWGGPNESCNGSVYTDRMGQWDYEKFNTLGKKIFGQGPWFGEGCDGQKVEQFLNEYLGKEQVKLLRVIEYCNQSSGYPLWRLDYCEPK